MISENIDVKILERDYRLTCSKEEKPRLMEAVALVDAKMAELRQAGKLAATERIAVMSALMIAHEFLQYRDSSCGEFKSLIQTSTEQLQQLNQEVSLKMSTLKIV
jgi:cell division protein ZapA